MCTIEIQQNIGKKYQMELNLEKDRCFLWKK